MLRAYRRAPVLALVIGLALATSALPAASQSTELVRSSSGMVASENWRASQVGADVLAAGGNAVDAAIATGLALAVVNPRAGNIGGGGFMVIRFPNGQSTAIDFREKAPLASYPEMWLDDDGEYSRSLHHNSYRAVGVPGTVAGFDKAFRLYGSAGWPGLVQPAVALAEDGFEVSERLEGGLRGLITGKASDFPATVTQFSKNGTPYEQGEILRQPDLARTLRRIMAEGRAGFYQGETARLLAAEMRRGGGMITEEDLDLYEAKERTPVKGSYRGYDIISMPPPSSGGVAIVSMLNILEGFDLASMGHNSAPYIHHLAEAMRRAYRDRAQYLADADFADVPLHRLTSKSHAADLRADIDPTRASISQTSDVQVTYESPETTHYSVVDGEGMAVSVTYTLEAGYGVGLVAPGTGFLLNNEMGDFNAGPGLTNETGLIGTEPNLARPQQRMLSSMSPSILARDGELVAVIGTPGGRTIINSVMEVMLNIIEFDMVIDDAVDAARFHHQWLPDRIRIEERGADPEMIARLEAMGHTVQTVGGQGGVHAIMIDPVTGERLGAADARHSDAGARGTGGN
jgi:gamma-glutamyltranspeptidase/glutathione hydrolase